MKARLLARIAALVGNDLYSGCRDIDRCMRVTIYSQINLVESHQILPVVRECLI